MKSNGGAGAAAGEGAGPPLAGGARADLKTRPVHV